MTKDRIVAAMDRISTAQYKTMLTVQKDPYLVDWRDTHAVYVRREAELTALYQALTKIEEFESNRYYGEGYITNLLKLNETLMQTIQHIV